MDYKPEDHAHSNMLSSSTSTPPPVTAESGGDQAYTSSVVAEVKSEPSSMEFRVADSLRDSFADPAQFQLIKHVLEGVNKNTTKRMLGEVVGNGGGGLLQDDEPYYEDSLNSEEDGIGGVNNSRGRPSEEGEEERKVRVRTLISEEQQLVLKTHYARNPKPKKEVLLEIAATIGHPFRVVKVWFQNMRARDRREGKHHHPHVPSVGSNPSLGGGGQAQQQRPPFPPGLSLNSPSAAAAAAAFLNNNIPFPLHQQAGRPLPLPLLRHPGGPLANHPLFPFPTFGLFEQHHNAVGNNNKSPGSSSSFHSEDNIEDEMEEDEEEEEEEEEEESAPLDLSNKGSSTPGASPSTDRDEVGPPPQVKLTSSSSRGDEQTPGQLMSSSSSSSSSTFSVTSEEEDESTGSQAGGEAGVLFPPTPCPHCSKVFTKRSSLARHVHDHSGECVCVCRKFN